MRNELFIYYVLPKYKCIQWYKILSPYCKFELCFKLLWNRVLRIFIHVSFLLSEMWKMTGKYLYVYFNDITHYDFWAISKLFILITHMNNHSTRCILLDMHIRWECQSGKNEQNLHNRIRMTHFRIMYLKMTRYNGIKPLMIRCYVLTLRVPIT